MLDYLKLRGSRLLMAALLSGVSVRGAEYAAELNRLQAPTDEVWEQQLYQGGIRLEPGASYQLSLTARSAEPGTSLLVTTKQDAPPWGLFGVNRPIILSNAWNRFQLTFKADRPIPAGSRLTFQFADAMPGTIWISNVTLLRLENGEPSGDNLLRNPRFSEAMVHWKMDGVGPEGDFYVGLVSIEQLEKTLAP